MNNLEKYNQIFMDVFGIDECDLNEGFAFATVEAWDSIAHLTLISTLEDEFDVMFETDDILHYGSYENGKKILARLGVEF